MVRRLDVRGVSFGGEGVENFVLSPRSERRAQVIETHVAPGGSPGPEPWSHAGDLVITTVLQGRLEFRFEGHTTVLEAGDTMAYSPAEPHSWGNPSDDTPALALFFGMPASTSRQRSARRRSSSSARATTERSRIKRQRLCTRSSPRWAL